MRARGGVAWDSFDRRQMAKEGDNVVAEVGDGGEDMFSRAGVAAE